MLLVLIVPVPDHCLLFTDRLSFEPRFEKTGLRGFRPGPTQTGLYNQRLEISDLDSRGIVLSRGVSKTKALISVFVFAYAKIRFSHNEAYFIFNRYTTCM